MAKFPEQRDAADPRLPFVPATPIGRLMKYHWGNMAAIRAKAAEAVQRGTPLTHDELMTLAGQSPACSTRTPQAA